MLLCDCQGKQSRARAAELADEAELRPSASGQDTATDRWESPTLAKVTTTFDRRLPIPGGVIVRDYKGRRLQVKVLEQGMEFEGQVFKSLSAVASQGAFDALEDRRGGPPSFANCSAQ